MYIEYNKLRNALEDFVGGDITWKEAEDAFKGTYVYDDPKDFYFDAMLGCESREVQISVILSMMGLGYHSATATDVDKADAILQQIEKAKEL